MVAQVQNKCENSPKGVQSRFSACNMGNLKFNQEIYDESHVVLSRGVQMSI